MTRIAIVDDNTAICSFLEDILVKSGEKYNVEMEIEPYLSGEDFIDSLNSGQVFDLVFLDIELNQINGIDVARCIRQSLDDDNQQIVFISAKEQYSLELHKFHPLDFLVKELKEDDVERVFLRFLKISGLFNDTFTVKNGRDTLKIKIKDIKYLTVINRIVYIILKDNKQIEYYSTLNKEYKDHLASFNFLFVHKQYIVNPQYVSIYEYDKVILNDGIVIPIGSSRRKEIRLQQLKLDGRLK